MKDDRSIQIMAYLDGTLSKEEKHRFERDLSESPELQRELDSLIALDGLIADVPEMPAPHSLQENLQYALIREKAKSAGKKDRFAFLSPLSVAAAVALLIIGTAFGVLWQRNKLQQNQINHLVLEVQNTRKMMILAMLDERSASSRIKALQTVQTEASDADPQVIEALLNTLNTDDNVNVRMKAAEALGNFDGQTGLPEALASSLLIQSHPEVQITLIDLLVDMKAQNSVRDLRKLMNNEDVHEAVKNKAAFGIQQLL